MLSFLSFVYFFLFTFFFFLINGLINEGPATSWRLQPVGGLQQLSSSPVWVFGGAASTARENGYCTAPWLIIIIIRIRCTGTAMEKNDERFAYIIIPGRNHWGGVLLGLYSGGRRRYVLCLLKYWYSPRLTSMPHTTGGAFGSSWSRIQ